jgi:hypothetical protein
MAPPAGLCAAIRDECAARQRLAIDCLAKQDVATHATGLHLWLKLPPRANCRELAARFKEMDVLVRTADAFAVDDTPLPNAIRLALSSPLRRESVEHGLRLIAAALTTAIPARGGRPANDSGVPSAHEEVIRNCHSGEARSLTRVLSFEAAHQVKERHLGSRGSKPSRRALPDQWSSCPATVSK